MTKTAGLVVLGAVAVMAACGGRGGGAPEGGPRTGYGAPPHGAGPYEVAGARVIDGDTLAVELDGRAVAVHLLGIDAPEGNTACGRAAAAALETLARNGLTLADDADPALTFDDRLMRLFHARAKDGARTSVAQALVAAGLARATGQGDDRAALAAAEVHASAAKRGCVWGGEVPAIPPPAASVEPVQTVTQAVLSGLPSSFSSQTVASGFTNPTAFAALPDGRILVAEKAGIVKVMKDGAVLATPLIDLRSRVNDYWDRGLLGLAVDPDFAANPYVYLLYVYENDASQYGGTKTSRLARYTVSGDTASVASELVLVGHSVGSSCAAFPVGADCIPADGASHSVGALRFAADGTLFATSGDAASFSAVDDLALRAQNLDSLAGKLIHVDRTGAGLPSNPFWNGDANAARSKVWAYGVRNAYRFNLRPGSGVPYLGDVGWNTTEEIDVAPAGANLGWPCYEGTPRQPGYAPKATCQALYAKGVAAVRAPLVEWNHNGAGAAATGGAFYTGTSYPAEYQGSYFFGDYAIGFLKSAKVDAGDALTGTPATFASTADGPVDIGMGPGGDLYYVAINAGELRRIRYDAPTPVGNGYLSDRSWASAVNGWGPVELDRSNGEAAAGDGRTITINGATFAKGLGVHAASDVRYLLGSGCTSFTAQVGIDDEVGSSGSAVFQVWLDGTKAYDSGVVRGTDAAKPVSVDVTGKSELRLVVTDAGDGASYDHSDWASARLACGSTPPPSGSAPVATIASPTSSLTYKVGDVVSFSGSATDAEDGALPASALSWQVIVHHCPGGVCHLHPFLSASGASGSFTVPDHGDESFFEVALTATDSTGRTGTASVSVQPQTVQLTLATSPPGLQVVYGGTAYTAPATITTIVGSGHTIGAPSPQSQPGATYTFNAWSDGGAAQHAITIGATNVTFTATFAGSTPPPSSDLYLSDAAWKSATNGWGPVERDRSNGESAAGDGKMLMINGTTFAKGLGAHAASDVRFAIPAGCNAFTAQVGVDDEVGPTGAVAFQVFVDGTKAYDSGVRRGVDGAVSVNVDVTGKAELRLVVTDGGDGVGYDHADWGDAKLGCSSTPPPPPVGAAPVATIASPTPSLTYEVGDVVAFSGSASDAEDGPLAASALSWQVILHHCPGGGSCHTESLLTQAGSSGSFTVPDHGDDTYLELVLTAKDSSGQTGTASVTIQPKTVTLTLATSAPGLQVSYDGTAFAAPKTVTTIVGSSHTIAAPSPQTVSGTTWSWTAWSDGGSAQHAIVVGAAGATLTASYAAGAPPPPSGDVYLSDRMWTSATNGWGPVERDRSNGEARAGDGRMLTVNGATFTKGLGVHAASDVRFALPSGCTRFTARVGVDDEVVGAGSVAFQVWLDGAKVYDSGRRLGLQSAVPVSVDVTGKSELRLVVSDGGDGNGFDHGDWGDAKLTCATGP